jgi:1D-myo-inositol-triphosphate 3-kinase
MESEVAKSSRRMDLLQKMIELDPTEPTEDERVNGVSKLRYVN